MKGRWDNVANLILGRNGIFGGLEVNRGLRMLQLLATQLLALTLELSYLFLRLTDGSASTLEVLLEFAATRLFSLDLFPNLSGRRRNVSEKISASRAVVIPFVLTRLVKA